LQTFAPRQEAAEQTRPAAVRAPARGPVRRAESPRSIRGLQRRIGNRAVPRHLSRGTAIKPETRARYEAGLHLSLADVRVHTDQPAAASAASLDAKAYTVGREIVFGAGRYRPGSVEGERLLAHELAHVVQQRRGGPDRSVLRLSRPGDRSEREAEGAAAGLLADRPAAVTAGSEPPGIYRDATGPGAARTGPTGRTVVTSGPGLGGLGVGSVGPGAEHLVLVREWLERHQFAPPEDQPAGEQHVLLNGEDMPLSRAVSLAAAGTNLPAAEVQPIVSAALTQAVPHTALGAAFVGGVGNTVPGLPIHPQNWQDQVRLNKALEIQRLDEWLDSHRFGPPEIRDPTGSRVLLDGEETTVERVADQGLASLGGGGLPRFSFLDRREVLAHVRQRYVVGRVGPSTQIAFGYTLVPRFAQVQTPTAPLNPITTQHQFQFTITRPQHAPDSPGREDSPLVGQVTLDDSGHIVSVVAGGQEAVVWPLLRGWLQVSGVVQVLIGANWSQTVSGTAAGAFVQAGAGGQVLVTPAFRNGPFRFLNGHVGIGVQAMGTVQASTVSGPQAGAQGGFVVNLTW
jgi:hypothetical protein